ncbi:MULTISPECIES: hypothetical protein [unclassified Crossiella]|uniref:hypothetical protein n=1 Tax=unclassified Crossiella TaxID=2620835 RepID=UPI002000290C|nr:MULTISPECIES: hypothetical protein [unclassified Crossiella]MCK2243737.1 hypothetical protein [Crossiella sp. S99.2]MCK2257596.1 hypothetical protein [Crossiella sp. S99.1]
MDSESLKKSSQRWMKTGLAAFTSGDDSLDFAVHHVGVSVEHLLKAYLASLHPALIAEGSDWDSLLHATGYGSLAKKPSTRAKTIGLAAAFGRAKRALAGKVAVTEAEFEFVLAARNGVAHAAHHDLSEVRAVLKTCIKVVDPILVELNIKPGEYWGDYLGLRDELDEERVNEIKVRVVVKVARAKASYSQRIKGLAALEREILIERLSAVSKYGSSRGWPAACVACDGRGWMSGFEEINSYGELDESDDLGYPDILYVGEFACVVCGLNLYGVDELVAAGVSTEIELPPVDWSVESVSKLNSAL